MRILMVASFLPYPLFSGGDIRLYNLMKNLKKDDYKITLICEKRHHQNASHIKKVKEVCEKVLTIDRKKQWTVQNVLKAGLSSSSFLSAGHKLLEMKRLVEEELRSEKYDLIHVETFYVYQNLPKTSVPVVLAEHNIEYLVYKRYTDKIPLLLRPMANIDVLKIKREEEKFWQKADRLIAVSMADKKNMGRSDTVIVPNGVDLKKFDVNRKIKKGPEERKVLFIGNFKWIQNIDAASWIIKNIWPDVLKKARDKSLDVELWVVGKRIPENLIKLGDQTMYFDENAPDATELIYKEADLLLAPIRVGGGTSFKILESMASGLPVLTTELGNEGIDGVSGKDIMICENSEQFAKASIDLLTDDKKYREISQNARNFIKNNFDWENITKKLEEVYSSLK